MQTWLNRYYTITAWVLLIQRCWLSPVYAIQPVVKRDVKPFWQPVKCLYTRYNRLHCVYKHSTGCQTRLTTGLTTGCIVYTAGCQAGCTTRFDNRLNEQLFVQHGCQTGYYNRLNEEWLFVQHGCQTGCQTGLTTGLITFWMFVYTIKPVVKPVVQPVWQPVVSCERGITKHREQNVRACECLEHAKVHTPIHTPLKLRGEGKLCREFKFEKQKP